MTARHWIISIVLIVVWGAGDVRTQGAVEYPGPAPGKAMALTLDNEILLENQALACKWSMADKHLRLLFVIGKQSPAVSLPKSECFQLLLTDGRTLQASDLKIVRGPDLDSLRPDFKAQRLAARDGGRQVRLTLATPDGNLAVQWRVELRDGSNYVRQYVIPPAEESRRGPA